MNRLERTLQDIRESVTVLESGLRMAQHPLYQTIWSHQEMSSDLAPKGPDGEVYFGQEWLAKHIQWKLDCLDRAEREKDWSLYVFTHERPYRVDALAELVNRNVGVTPALILEVWQDTEFPHQSQSNWRRVFGSVTTDMLNEALDEDEQAVRAELPPMLTLYRGVGDERSLYAWSWTLDRDRAEWFSTRFRDGDPIVYEWKAKKSFLVGPLLGRGENEMLDIKAMPHDINKARVVK